MFLVIDNYDSFTYNLVHLIGQLGVNMEVVRNDKIAASKALAMNPEGIILSPGPCTPNEAGICLELIREAGGKMPIFGVCLGMQAIGQAYGGTVIRASRLMHGKMSAIVHDATGMFEDIPTPFQATRYHSLVVEDSSFPDSLVATAKTDDGSLMGLSHKTHPVHGVQFHPESIASEHGDTLLRNFIGIARTFNKANRLKIAA
ncbi:aminodeoxychorismate/anthranilate synthase component II [Pararhizobium sp. IMCC21322]|uniref:anthranilate synthase component II n=1 Tax=Pararhizobium sp. IMCC21322 TaxID=3067903 RepID=UPI0027411CA5|nr:aminodeoxychorismate/anthranilate synthase component II [Pararhizobium sp. IMCC21322]